MTDSQRSVAGLSPAEVKGRIDRGERLALLDVREPHERRFVAIPAGPGVLDIHIPLAAIPARLDELRAAVGDLPLIVYCHHGVRSLMAAHWLAGQGFPGPINLEGGIDAWSVEADPGLPRYI